MTNSRAITLLALGLTIFGLIMIGSASVVDASRDFGDKWFYLKLQSAWAVIGIIAFFISSRVDYRRYQKYAFPIFSVTFVLLLVVLIPGIGTKLLGARRWINMGFFLLQPSELAKLTMAIYFSAILTKKEKVIPFFSSLAIVSLLIVLEPDLGTALVIIGMGFLTFFGSGGKISYIVSFACLGLLGVIFMVLVSPYRLDRLKSYMNTSHDPLGSSYQIRQAIIAIGTGKVFGAGLGQSRQKYNFLPESTTDSIFAIIGEELGLIGTTTVLIAFLLMATKGLTIAGLVHAGFPSNLAISLTSIIAVQAFINISAISALFPLTGIPLSFISYGGSSLVIMFIAAGILVNIASQYDNR